MIPADTKITFDTNAVDKACRPERHPKDPLRPDYDKVNAALKSGYLQGYVSETVITLEGVQRVDRARVFGGTHLVPHHSPPETDAEGAEVHRLTLKAEQPAHQPLHSENAARLATALSLGFRVLSAPRIGAPKNR